MKKIILSLVVVLASCLSANAFVDNQYMITENYMVNTGYSKEMARMAAVTTQDPYREPYNELQHPENLINRIYHYIAPTMRTNSYYYNHSVNINNTGWTDF